MVERETIALPPAEPLRLDNLHVQAWSRVRLEQEGAPVDTGIGVFEQLILGLYSPMGLAGFDDPIA
ncbi:MAG: hypothetical protein ABJD97_17335 [Betaproteobacteria bacterium]